MNDLFDDVPQIQAANETIAPGAVLLHGFALGHANLLLTAFNEITMLAPLRQMITPGGHAMSVVMSNCGLLGLISDGRGYRYLPLDPSSGEPWLSMPDEWLALAGRAAAQAGYADFQPDACLINAYAPGSKMSLHQDRDEQDFAQPIVSVSLGLPAVFLFGGLNPTAKPQRLPLIHGVVVVWGGPARLAFYGVAPLADGLHCVWGRRRVNLTFRCAA